MSNQLSQNFFYFEGSFSTVRRPIFDRNEMAAVEVATAAIIIIHRATVRR